MSPLSETTILTAQLVEVKVSEHIKRQAWTSVPAFLISLVLFALLGLGFGPEVVDEVSTEVELGKLTQLFHITLWNLVPLVLLMVLSFRKVPPSLALMAAALTATSVLVSKS